jgi:putative acetyltransferase
VSRIELTVFTDNERAIALYRKHGFEIEGTHRAYALRAGVYSDTYSMARIRAKPNPGTQMNADEDLIRR